MMLFIFITYIFFLIGFSSGDQCPSWEYCTCSSDLTIIKCTNRQLTDELLLKLNTQLPNSTIILNLSSNSLTSIKSLSNLNSLQILDLSFNKIRYLPSNIFSKFPQLTSLYIQNNSIKTFPKNLQNLSNNFPQINPQQSQIVYENQQFILNCSSNSKRFWTLNKYVYPTTIVSSSFSTIIIHHLQLNHSGIWTCHTNNFNRSISLKVLKNSSNHFCQSIQMNTSKGYFYWPRTLINKKIEKKCPFGSAAWLSNSTEHPRAWYTCSSNGQWKNFDISQCGFQTNISRVFDYLSLNETNLLLNLVKYLSKINRNHMKFDDIILLIDLIDEQQEKYQNQDRIMLIYHLTDFILQIKHDFIFIDQYQFAITRLRLIIERLLDFTNQSWLYIGKEITSMTVQSPLPSTLCFVPNRSLLTMICEINNQEYKSQLLTVQFPSHSDKTNQYSLFRIIVYRQSTIFTSDKTKTNHDSPVIYIRPVTKNNFSTIKLTFSDPLNQVSIGVWNINKISWEITSSICKINEQNNNLISTDCILFNNNSLSITYFNTKNIFLNKKYSKLIISILSIIASICFIISIVFYICFHKIYQMPKHFFHCLINYWFSLAILIPLFAFGIQLNYHPFICQFITIILHYLCLTTILWLTLLTYSIWCKLYVILKDKENYKKSSNLIIDNHTDEVSIKKIKSKSVIQYYLLSYGIGLIICGINAIVSREEYIINKICFLNNFYSILILIIPILIFIVFILIFLLISRNYIKKLSNKSKENTEEILLNSYFNSLDIDYQYESINQLLSILFQLILLIFLFLSSLSINLHPLYSFKLRFEHIIYSHLYGFFVLFLSFYILSFHVLSRLHLIIQYYSNKTKDDHLSNKSSLENSINNKEYDIPSFTEKSSTLPLSNSNNSSTRHVSHGSQNTIINNDNICAAKRLTNITSKYYICHNHILNTNSSQNILNDVTSLSSSDTISQGTIDTHRSSCNSSFEQSSKRSINIPVKSHRIQTENTPLNLSPLTSSRSFTYPPMSPSQAIIRPLAINRLSSQDKNKNLSMSTGVIQVYDQNSCGTMSSHSAEEFYIINKTDHSIQEESFNENFSIVNKSSYDHERVLFIDEDDEHSVSLKSSICESKTSSCSMSTKKNRSQTLSISSSLSSSNFSNDFQIKLLESSV